MPSAAVPPVTVISGFLGAGKTTLLRHLLSQAEGERWALLVNDVAALNVDAGLLEGIGGADVYALGNGCVCCSIKDDLAETLCRLAAEGSFDRLLVETTGVAEPRAIAQLFTRRNPFGRSVADFARLEALATVVDAADFLRRWDAGRPAREALGGRRELAELVLEQAECADLLVVNKCDLVAPADLDRLEGALAGLNPRASILRTERSQVAREWILGTQRFDAAATSGAARWITELNEAAGAGDEADVSRRGPVARRVEPSHTLRFGLRSFVFKARLPFAQEKLETLLRGGLPGIVRAKGLLWLAERPDETAFLSLTPSTSRIDWLNWWWGALIENGKASLAERPDAIRRLWIEPHGDRRQELVFIGVDYDEPALRRSLEACLKTTV